MQETTKQKKEPHEYRGFKIIRYERPSKNRRFGNLKFWTTDPQLHGDRIIYKQTRAEMQTEIDLHLDGPQKRPYGAIPGTYIATCSGCRKDGTDGPLEIVL